MDDDDLVGKTGRTSLTVSRSRWHIRLEVPNGRLNTGHRRDGGAGDLSVKMTREDDITQGESLWREDEGAEDLILVFEKCEDQTEAMNKNRHEEDPARKREFPKSRGS